MFTKACFDELGGGNACQIQKDQRSLQNRNLLGIVWSCGIKLIHRKSSISFTAFYSSLLSARLCKWHKYREILSQTCLWISWHNTGIVETIRKSVEDKSFATKKLEQKEEHQGMLHEKFLHLPNESRGFVAYLCYRASWQLSQRKGIVVLSWWKALGAIQPREQISQASSEKNWGEASALHRVAVQANHRGFKHLLFKGYKHLQAQIDCSVSRGCSVWLEIEGSALFKCGFRCVTLFAGSLWLSLAFPGRFIVFIWSCQHHPGLRMSLFFY